MINVNRAALRPLLQVRVETLKTLETLETLNPFPNFFPLLQVRVETLKTLETLNTIPNLMLRKDRKSKSLPQTLSSQTPIQNEPRKVAELMN